MKKIVILGGGYGGYKIANNLLHKGLPDDAEIILIDRTPYHTLKTEFYALAAGTVADKEVRMDFPVHEKLQFICDSITAIDLNAKEVMLEKQDKVPYDYLIIGLGCEDNYHQITGAKEFTYSVQSIEKTRTTFEAINNIPAYGQITIIGAGLTGVELASEVRESRSDLKIRLLDKGETILPSLPKRLQDYVTTWLLENNIEVIHNSHVQSVEKNAVTNDGMCLYSDATVWAGGIQPNKIVRDLDIEKDKYGRIIIDDYHRIENYKEVFVVGDCASVPFPPSGQVAQVQGNQIVEILSDILRGREPKKPGKMKIKGALGSLGKSEGFGTAFGMGISGPVARLLKSGVLWLHKFNR
jgi:NADH dehydrogenase